jgi:hypothetical protein
MGGTAPICGDQTDHGHHQDEPADREVDRFLRAHPGWLAARPELYRALTPPERVHGEAIADHLTAMVRRERRHAQAMTEQAVAVLAAGRTAAVALTRVHEAVLALIAAATPAECLLSEVPRLLGADAACLARRGVSPEADALTGALEQALGTAEVVFRTAPLEAAELYREAESLALHDALVRLPGFGVLAMGYRSRPDGGNGAAAGDLRRHLGFLGRVAALLLPARAA